ncbi:ABC transporter substrate-binding protein [Halobellus rufus]|uniref:ABC transporter substrate-binding protein n=1 Tax=Halobellus rufus TaxID=1448860 RepID=UPI0009DE6FA6|nr:ABC transporter substrate-binding protein [Halobellus rufus]
MNGDTVDRADTGQSTSETKIGRRRALRGLGAGALATALSTAGCVQQTGDGGSDETDTERDTDSEQTSESSGSDLGPVTFGVLVPESGPSAPLGTAQRQGAELGVKYVNESDEFDFEIDAVYEDTQTDPSTGLQRAEQVVENDGAAYVVGALESSVALAVADYVSDRDVVYTSGAATIELTGESCNGNTFRAETNAAQQMAGLADFAAAELGTKMWIHTTDDAYGNSAVEQIERRIEARGLDIEVVGKTIPDKGTSNYGPQISNISNSEADVLAVPDTGADLINFVKQANSAGLTDQVDLIGTAIFAQVSRQALGSDAIGAYSSTLYNHKLETGDNEQFVEAYREEYDGVPGSFARVGYDMIRMTAHGIQEAGTSDPAAVATALEDLSVTTALGTTRFRACDHQAVNPVWTGEVVEGDEIPAVELLETVSGDEAIRPCEETGCSL